MTWEELREFLNKQANGVEDPYRYRPESFYQGPIPWEAEKNHPIILNLVLAGESIEVPIKLLQSQPFGNHVFSIGDVLQFEDRIQGLTENIKSGKQAIDKLEKKIYELKRFQALLEGAKK
jgi:hypothetical protein